MMEYVCIYMDGKVKIGFRQVKIVAILLWQVKLFQFRFCRIRLLSGSVLCSCSKEPEHMPDDICHLLQLAGLLLQL